MFADVQEPSVQSDHVRMTDEAQIGRWFDEGGPVDPRIAEGAGND